MPLRRLGRTTSRICAARTRRFPDRGAITIVGPGTGLGVAHLWRGDGRLSGCAERGRAYRLRAGRCIRGRPARHASRALRPCVGRKGRRGSGHFRHLRGARRPGRSGTDPVEDKNIWTRGLDGKTSWPALAYRAFLHGARQRRGRPRPGAWRGRRRDCRRGRPAVARFPAHLGVWRAVRRQGAVQACRWSGCRLRSSLWPSRGWSARRRLFARPA